VGAMVDDSKFQVDKFNGQNFALWKMQIEDYLLLKDLYLPLGGKAKQLSSMTDEAWELLDRKALMTIGLCLGSQVAFNISKEKTTKDVMNALTMLYEKPSASNKTFLMKKFFNMKMNEGEFVQDHLNDFNEVTNNYALLKLNLMMRLELFLFYALYQIVGIV